MDYDKPEALNPLMFAHHSDHQSPQPDGETTLHGFDEPAVPEDRREFRGDSLWYEYPQFSKASLPRRQVADIFPCVNRRVLHERHVNVSTAAVYLFCLGFQTLTLPSLVQDDSLLGVRTPC